MRFVVPLMIFALALVPAVRAQEPAPLPMPRPQSVADGKGDPGGRVGDADEDDGTAAESGDDDGTAMPELTPLIPERLPPRETVAEGPPVPRPKPEQPVASDPEDEAEEDGEPEPEKPKPTIASAPEQPKPKYDLNEARRCEAELRRFAAAFEVADPIDGEGQCGWPRPLRLKSLSRDLNIRGDIWLRCEMALALARWAKEVVVPSAELHMGSKPVAVEISTSYQCRRRNNGSAGKLSEHAFANGIDLMAIHFEDGKRVAVADRRGSSEADRAFQAAVRGGACAYFTTVLGPVADANHSDHFHFDLAVRRGGYRLCQ